MTDEQSSHTRIPGAAQHEVVRCRTGIVADSEFATVIVKL